MWSSASGSGSTTTYRIKGAFTSARLTEGLGGGWTYLSTPAPEQKNSGWSRVSLDISRFEGLEAQIGFYHTASNYSGSSYGTDVASGWYIDDVEIWRGVPEWTGAYDFADGWGDW